MHLATIAPGHQVHRRARSECGGRPRLSQDNPRSRLTWCAIRDRGDAFGAAGGRGRPSTVSVEISRGLLDLINSDLGCNHLRSSDAVARLVDDVARENRSPVGGLGTAARGRCGSLDIREGRMRGEIFQARAKRVFIFVFVLSRSFHRRRPTSVRFGLLGRFLTIPLSLSLSLSVSIDL
jgi:hypothetical protein